MTLHLHLAQCVAFARWALQMHAISKGLGTALDVQGAEASIQNVARVSFRASEVMCSESTELIRAKQSSFMIRILLIVCLYLAKISVIVFSRKVFSGDLNHQTIFFTTAYVVVAAGGLASILAASVGCHGESYLLSTENLACEATVSRARRNGQLFGADTSQLARSVVICASDALSEIAIVVVPIVLLTNLQMTRSKKLAVCSVYLVRFG